MQSDLDTLSRYHLLHGRSEPPVTPLPLRAGDLSVLYEDGALRLIRRGGREVVRSIYIAVRNETWRTVPGQITDEKIEQREDSFEIAYRREYDWNGVRYAAQVRITGDAQGIAFSFLGTARSEFKRNRIGICVLHPVRECVGVECEITTPEGAVIPSAFPVRISPTQPFFNVQAMRWPCGQDCAATLEFEGDVFETEDQRNFADASYKTYSTPQSRPKPVAVLPGDEVAQRVMLRVAAQHPTAHLGPEFVTVTLAEGAPRALPALGLSVSPADAPLTDGDVQAIRALRLSHLRAALDVTDLSWPDALHSARKEAAALGGLPLDLALTFGPEPERAWGTLRVELERDPISIRSVLLLTRGRGATSPEVIALAPAVRAALPGATVGGGTDGYFIGLNSNPAIMAGCDFLSSAAHPQVHLEDNRTITENAASLADIVLTVRASTQSHAVHIAPLTLRPDADPRQKSLFGAVWALSSIKHLAEAGADSVTFGAVAGPGGILHDASVFPLYFVLHEIWGDGPADALPSASDDPSRVEGLFLRRGDAMRLLLGNTSPLTQAVRVAWDAPQARVRLLDEETARRVLSDPKLFQGGEPITRDASGFLSLSLPPFAVAVLES